MSTNRFFKLLGAMMHLPKLFLLLLFTGCMQYTVEAASFEPRGELFAYFRITESAFSGPNEATTGYYFYIEKFSDVRLLNGYQYLDGEVIDSFGTGSQSISVMEAIERVGFQPFDFESELAAADQRAMQAGRTEQWITEDGQEWEIFIQTDDGPFVLKRWNPGSDFKNNSGYSERIAKLEEVIRILTSYYGESKIGIL